MAEDGLLVNFDLGSDPITFKSPLRGGDWKQRRQIKRRQVTSRSRDVQASTNEHQPDQPHQPLAKRLKADISSQTNIKGHKNRPVGSREVISSLFSFNPVSTSATKHPHHEAEQDVSPSNAPLPDGSLGFRALGLHPSIASHLTTKLSLENPTAIQNTVVPRMLEDDSDVFIQAQTGSGKTLAYLLPLVHRLMGLSNPQSNGIDKGVQIGRHSGLFAIILAPTRELAKQISVVLEDLLGCAHWLVPGTVIGGEKKKSEKARLRRGLNILIATPGRLVDHLSNTKVLDVSQVRWLILDEGDRLMELGFEEDIKSVVNALETQITESQEQVSGLPRRRTTVLCSATMRTNVQRLGEISLKDAIHLRSEGEGIRKNAPKFENTGSSENGPFSAPAQLKQSYIVVPPKQRLVSLIALLRHSFARKGSVMKIIVFLSCASSVDFHFLALSRDQPGSQTDETLEKEQQSFAQRQQLTTAAAPMLTSHGNVTPKIFKLHGSLAQSLRTTTLASFSKAAEPSVLLCTDVASRGLDLPAIDLVIEYDPAFSAEDHLHRIGRTARAGRDGRATIFLLPGPEEAYAEILKESYKEVASARIARQDAEEVMRRGFTDDVPITLRAELGAQRRTWDDQATEHQLEVERWVLENKAIQDLARNAYISHVRAYATHTVSERHMFDIKNLHLGHIAKAFGLREPPTNMGRSKVSANGRGKKSARNLRRARGELDEEQAGSLDRDDAKRKMREAMRTHMNAASEFNIG